LAGRQPILDKTKLAIERLKIGRSEKSFLLVGLRGVGKTVLLNEIDKIALNAGCKSFMVEAHEDKQLPALLLPKLREILYDLDRMASINSKVKRGFKVLKSFFNGVKAKMGEVEFSLDVDPETGTADSGDLESDLPVLLQVIAEAASARNTVVCIIIDEMQFLSEKELSALIMGMHKISQNRLPLMLIGAGLPQLVALSGNSKTYAERLFDFPLVGPLQNSDAIKAVQNPVQEQKVEFSKEALDEIIEHTKGYPYFLQEWGYHAWNEAVASPIDKAAVDRATVTSIKRLDESFFRVRFDRLTPREKVYLRALAKLGSGPQKSGEIAAELKVKPQSVAPVRNNLIRKGMIFSPTYGDTEFTVPLFDEFMKRVMP
jgi:hypothetical protein